jgi:serine phosphatase RsbU (regulator of sigma subunit)
VVIGDVAGHDQQAAAAMAQVRNILRGVAFTRHPDSPSGVLQGLERAIGVTGENIVATAVLAQVTATATHGVVLTWSNAGHPPPVLLLPDGTTRLLDTEPDLLLGLDDGAPRIDTRLTLVPGSTVVLYTDGLIERRDASVTDGLAWLEGLLRDRQDLGVEEICDFLLSSAGPVEDDVALLVLRV